MSTARSVSPKIYVPIVVLALAILGAAASAFVVRVDQFAIVIQFGEPVNIITDPGLYFRLPFVQQVQYFDRRIMEWDDTPQVVMTKDKKRIHINTFARWRIADPLLFLQVVRTEELAQLNLDKILGATVRDVISDQALDEVVRDTNRPLTYSEETTDEPAGSEAGTEGGAEAGVPPETRVRLREKKTIEIRPDRGRSNLIHLIFEMSRGELRTKYGIELIDIQIKQLNYTGSTRRQVIKEMISERMVVVEEYESDGKREQETIRGQIDRTLQLLTAEANERRLRLEGQGQAQAIAIKSAAFGRDPELYRFLETLRLYEESFDERTTLVLTSDHPLLTLLKGPPSMALPLFTAPPAN